MSKPAASRLEKTPTRNRNATWSGLTQTILRTGAIYLDDCPDRRIIPIWLIVFGCVSLVQSFIDIGKRCFRKKNEGDEDGAVRERGERRKTRG